MQGRAVAVLEALEDMLLVEGLAPGIESGLHSGGAEQEDVTLFELSLGDDT